MSKPIYSPLLDEIQRLINDRDKWKSLAQALAQAIYQDCTYCKNRDCGYVKLVCDDWQFDEKRFVGGENNE